MPIDKASGPWQIISYDNIGPLPNSNGYDSIFVVVDHFTKQIHLRPTKTTATAEDLADLFIEHIWKLHGIPLRTISDRGPTFNSAFIRRLWKELGIKPQFSTAYHPQTDGQTERMNQELEVYLCIFCARQPDEWAEHLINAEVAHNQRTHSAQSTSPFYLMMGYEPRLIPIAYPKTHVPSIQEQLAKLQKARDEALAAHKLARHIMQDRFKGKFMQFKKGQKVWLESKNLKLAYASRKLAPKREGPFVITEVIGPVTYRLDLPQVWKIHPVFHACLLSPYKENEVHGPNYARPPPDLIEGDDTESRIVRIRRIGQGDGERPDGTSYESWTSCAGRNAICPFAALNRRGVIDVEG